MITLKRVKGEYVLTIDGDEVRYKSLKYALGIAWISYKYGV